MEDGGLPGFSLEEIKVERPETRCKTRLNTGLTRQRRMRREAYTYSKRSVGTSLGTALMAGYHLAIDFQDNGLVSLEKL
jgi:hypothetical protein